MDKVTKRLFELGPRIQHIVVGKRLALSSSAYVYLEEGTDGYPVRMQFCDRRGAVMEKMGMDECINLSDIPRMFIDTGLIADAVAEMLIQESADGAFRDVFSIVAARASILTVELDLDEDQEALLETTTNAEDLAEYHNCIRENGEVIFTLTCGTYRSEVKRPFQEVASILVFVPDSRLG